MEHHSNTVPWHFLRERHGAVLKFAPVDDDGNFLIDEFEKLLTEVLTGYMGDSLDRRHG
jgi:cysteine desulfurase/selenocysteine lyase